MNPRGFGRRCRRAAALLTSAAALLASGGCGTDAPRAARAVPRVCPPPPTPGAPAPGSPWALVAANLPADFGGQVWVASGAGRIYAAGADRVISLDVASATWSDVGVLPRRRSPSTMAVGRDGTLYVVGGAGRPGRTGGANTDVDAFNPTTRTWMTEARLTDPRNQPAATGGADGRIYVFGGGGADGNPVATAEAYTPATNTWRRLTPMPTPGEAQVAVPGADGRIYVVGGAPTNAAGTAVRIYDTARDSWAEAAPLPVVRIEVGVAALADGRLVVLGGRDQSSNAVDTVAVFDPAVQRWTTLPPMTRPRVDPGAALGADGRVYAIGGDIAAAAGCPLVGTVEAAPPLTG